MGNKYLQNPDTLGERVRNRRLQLDLLQKDVANIIGVTEDTITNWENNHSKPDIFYFPRIINFLGYMPFKIDTSTLAGKMKEYRYLNGLSQETLAKELGINESSVFYYEKGKHSPNAKTSKKLERILN